MKGPEPESWMVLNRLTPGRRVFALRKMLVACLAFGLAELATRCETLIAENLLQLERWRVFKTGQALTTAATWSPEVLALDVELDRLLSELRDLLAALGRSTRTARGKAAKALYDAHFAVGLPWYTQVPIEDEDARVGELIRSLRSDPALLATATADEAVDDVALTHGRYAAQVVAHVKARRADYATVKAGELACHRALLELIAQVFTATFAAPEAERAAQRAQILEELARQDEELSDIARARRSVHDVDPDSGAPEG